MRLKAIRVRTGYWRPGTDYVRDIVNAVKPVLEDGDVVAVSEKAISTAEGLLLDESKFAPGRVSKFLATFWMRFMWGLPLGCLTNLRQKTLERLREYPKLEGAVHKQVALMYAGILQALRHYSEGGIDASNLPYNYVSLPLADPLLRAEMIRRALSETGKEVSVLIVDGDTAYSWRNLHLSPRGVEVPGLVHFGGFLTFVAGRKLGFVSRSTPVALSGEPMNPDWALTLANVAHRVRGHGAGRTVWDMAERLGVGLTEVTWGMLDEVKHYPIVIMRRVSD
ncbi:MAG: coenzyme F420-0:L-glutamate ligase [Candidatus Bathyarchaeota archaeon]|nr:MAG: coenzyme F420-0:L-glutamate ligase [Candidatus Bathyarchaeota archaeon]